MNNTLMREGAKEFLRSVRLVDIPHLANSSVMNHHADGMHYLCLQRTETHTVKIYYIPKPVNNNGGFLVNPHNHRYKFSSVVMSGALQHLRFSESENKHGDQYVKNRYFWETKEVKRQGMRYIYAYRDDLVTEGGTYTVTPDEIHTLKILKPTIIALSQEADTDDEAYIYIRPGQNFRKPRSRPMTPNEYLGIHYTVMKTLGLA
jgi:hypothetical protein